MFDDVFRQGETRLPLYVLAKRLDVEPATVRNWYDKGTLKATKLGGRLFVSPKDFEDFIARCNAPAVAKVPQPA